ncbi:MAG: hypothetical protein AVDCRST_MAG68-1069, partial [uncultured Gemmatimonadetes bacterium]
CEPASAGFPWLQRGIHPHAAAPALDPFSRKLFSVPSVSLC